MAGRGAFSLIELITVMAIITIMIGLVAPAVSSMTSTAGRKGALNILMNTFEQGRAAALESGAKVYVVFWKRQFPEQDSLIVMRDAVEWIPEEKDKANSGEKIFLSRWIKMPKGVLLYDGKGQNVFKSATPAALVDKLPKAGDATPLIGDVGYIEFTPTGAISHPPVKEDCRLYVSEGVRGQGGTEAIIASRKEHTGFEIITFRRFTGRASVDVSTLN